MNNTYKSIWNDSLGAWVAVSELAGSKGKQSKSAKAGKVAGVFALTLLGAATSTAWAQSCPNGVNTIFGGICAQDNSATGAIEGSTYTQTTGLFVTTGAADLRIKDSSVTIDDPETFGFTAKGSTGASIKFSSTNDINLNAAASDMAVMVNNGGTVTINNSGKINTTGKIQSTTKGGSTRGINLDDITTTDYGVHGINVIGSAVGAIDIDNRANITTSGVGANGINASAKNGDVTIKNSGNIKTQSTAETGAASKGINVVRDLTYDVLKAGGNISISSTGGAIETGKIEKSHAIAIESNSTSGDINVNLADTNLIVNSILASGIYINETQISAGTEVNTTNVNVTTKGGSIQVKSGVGLASTPSNNYGIFVVKNNQISSGNITIDNGANITLEVLAGKFGLYGGGIYAETNHASSTGNVSVTNSGNISVDPEKATGIYARNKGAGNVEVNNSGSITTKGEFGHGIAAYGGDSLTGASKVTNSGKISTTGDRGSGIYTGSTGLSEIINTKTGVIITKGDFSHGIYGRAFDGTTVITNKAAITTAGEKSHGIYSTTVDADATIHNDASITTSGSDASGIRADQNMYSTSGDITITTGVNSYLETNGEQADGIHATIGDAEYWEPSEAAPGSIKIDAQGSIKTKGLKTAEGIYAAILKPDLGSSTGNIEVTFRGDTIETTGAENNRGIYALQEGSGNVNVNHNGQLIKTAGAGAHGIYALTQAGVAGVVAGKVVVNSKGKIATSGVESHGIFVASSNDTAGITVTNEGHITVDGATASGIKVASGGAGDVTVVHKAGATVTSTGNNLVNTGAIRTDAVTTGKGTTATGDVFIYSYGDITTEGANRAAGIYAYNQGTGGATVNATGNITASATNKAGAAGDIPSLYSYGIGALVSDNVNSTGNATVNYSQGTIKTAGGDGYALYAGLYNTKTGVATVSNTDGGILNTTGAQAYGIWSRDETLDGGQALASNMGKVSTEGDRAHGVFANSHKGYAEILSSGDITTAGENARGISAAINPAAGNFGAATGIYIQTDGGSITTSGRDGTGIRASTTAESGDIKVNMNGTKIKVQNWNADGIYANNMLNNSAGLTTEVSTVNIDINTTGGEITADTGANISASNYGIVTEQLGAAKGHTNINITGTKIKSLARAGEGKNSAGVMATYTHADGIGNINVTSTGEVLTQGMERGASAYRLTNNGIGEVDFKHGGSATATGEGASGVYIRSNTGKINVKLDRNSKLMGGYGVDATLGVNAAGLQLERVNGAAVQTVTNAGTIGALSDQAVLIISDVAAASTLTNTGTITGNFDLAKAAGNVTFNNNAGGVVELRGFADTDGDGVRDAKSVAISNFGTGATSAFTNNVGATLKLAGFTGEATTVTTGEYIPVGALSSSTAGVTHAQMLNLKRFANAGLIDLTGNGMAGDVLVLSGGATAGSNGGGEYISNGGTIQFDTVLNAGGAASQSDMLVLDDVVMGSGATKIRVKPTVRSVGGYTQGDGIKLIEVLGTQNATAFVLDAPVTYGTFEYLLYADDATGAANGWYLRNYDRIIPGGGGSINRFRNPNIGAFLGNQYAASNMFNQNILDRRDNVRAPDQNVWVRANHNEVKTDMLDGLQHAKIKTNLFQIGVDVIKHNDFIAGVYTGYGDSSINNRSNQTGTKADGKVTGYHLGAYGSWMPEENKGPYVDVWGHYGWYKNKLEGAAQRYDSVKYDSTGYSLSAEVGYGFELKQDAKGRAWILEPHVQGIYSKLSSDSFLDKNLTYYSDNKSDGIQTRVGARFYGKHTLEGKKGILPFVEANWLHNGMKNGVSLNYENTSSKVGKNVGEVKVGVQGNVSEKFSLFSHVGAQKGSDSFKRYEFQFGLNYNW